MLEYLSQNDQQWRRTALTICKDKALADEIVQTMYLKIYENNIDLEKLSKKYVNRVLINLCKDFHKSQTKENEKTLRLDDTFDISQEDNTTYFCDEDLNYLDKAKELSEEDQSMLALSYDHVIRDIADIKDVSYSSVFVRLKNARKEMLGEDYDTKYKKQKIEMEKDKLEKDVTWIIHEINEVEKTSCVTQISKAFRSLADSVIELQSEVTKLKLALDKVEEDDFLG